MKAVEHNIGVAAFLPWWLTINWGALTTNGWRQHWLRLGPFQLTLVRRG
jgi:hypothetical protein